MAFINLSKKNKPCAPTIMSIAYYCSLTLVILVFQSLIYDEIRGSGMRFDRPCDEIYVVQQGETLHTISSKCGDPYIVEHNPHIHDPDDVFPGLVLQITPHSS
ncbi:peptidoglycan-binding LysM domain-containing protein [Euphorbia peplus]|nr:peptidoglycan-binding LysM domain-containing protein [Euphorbia peplus]